MVPGPVDTPTLVANSERPSGKRERRSGRRDLLVVAALCVAVFGVGVWLDIHHAITRWLNNQVQFSTGELEGLLGLALGGASAIAALRWHQASKERRLRSTAEENYRMLVEQVPAITYSWDPTKPTGTQKPLYVSPQIEHILGYTPQEWMTSERLWIDRIHPDDRELVVSASDESDRLGTPFVLEYRMFTKDGRVVWLHDEATVVADGEGNPQRAQGVMYDITQRKQIEEQLQDAEDRYRTIVERVPAVSYVWDAANEPGFAPAIYVSPQIEQLLGYTPEEWTEGPEAWADRVHPEDVDRVLGAWRSATAARRSFSADYRIYRKDGELRWVRDEAAAVAPGADGHPQYQGVMIDITESRRTLQEVEIAERRYREILEHLPVVAYMVDSNEADGVLRDRWIGPGIEALTGYTTQEWMAEPDIWPRLTHPDDREAVDQAWEHAARGGLPFASEYRIAHKDGRTVWIRDEAVVIDRGDSRYAEGVFMDITSRREAEAQLTDAEGRYRTLVEQLPLVTYLSDLRNGSPQPVPLYVAPSIEQLTGVTPQEWLSNPASWSSLIHPDDRERVLAEAERSDRIGGPFDQEYRMVSRDQRVIWVHDRARIVQVGDSDRRSVWQGVFEDITTRRDTEALLEQAELRFRTLVERIPAVTYIEDPVTGETLYISPQMEEMFGYSTQEWMSHPGMWTDRLHPDDRDWVTAADDADSGDSWSIDYRMIHRDGRTVWVHNDAVLIRNDAGDPLYWQGVVFDITERKAAEEQLLSAEERYRTLVEQLPAVVYIDAIDEFSTALYISPQYERIFGFTPQERTEDPGLWMRQIYPEDRDRVLTESARTDRTGDPFDIEYRWIRADGATIWVHDQATQVEGPDGVRVWQGVLTDITARKTAEHALTRRDQILQAAGLAAERFLRAPSWVECIDEVLARVGEADGASRAFVFRNDRLEDGRLAMTKIFEWNALGVEPTLDEPYNAAYPYEDGYEDWEARLPQGATMQGLVGQLEPRQREWLEREAVRSSLAVPVFVGGEWWGFIGLDQCDEEREWQPAEVEALRVVASTLGAAIGRVHAADRLTETENRYRSLIEQLPTATYIVAVEGNETRYMSPQIEQILGYSADEWTIDLWERLLHPEDVERVLAEDARTTATGDRHSIEYRLRARDGRWVWVHDDAQRVLDASGTPIYWQGVRADITERKEAEHQLRAAEERYRRLVEQLPVITYVDDYDPSSPEIWPTSYISPQIQAILGYSAEEWMLDPTLWAKLVYPEDLARANRANEHHYASGEPLEMELRVFHKDGSIRWIRDEAVIIRGEDGVPRQSQGILQDVTERRAAEEQLHEAEERYRTLIESMPAITYIDTVDPSMQSVYVSPQVLPITGFTPQEWIDDAGLWSRQVAEEDLDWLLAAISRHNVQGDPYDVEYRFRHKAGHWVWFKDSAVMLRDGSGDPIFSQGVIFDITERKNAEEQLREAEERYRAIVEHVPAVIYVDAADASMRTVYISPHVHELTGYTPEEWIDDPDLWRRTTYVDDRETVMETYKRALAAEQPWDADYRMVTRDGRTIWVHDETTIIRDEAGAPRFLQGVIFDVTERKLAEQALRDSEQRERDAAERLRALDEMKNTFLAAVSHELRSPLTSILGLSLTLERTREMPEADRNDLLERLSANARKLDRLLKDLLDIDRLNRGIVEPQYRLTDVGSLARRVIESLDALADRAVQVAVESVVVSVDPAKVERILENLVMNAVRHTAGDRTIWLKVAPDGDSVLITVEDDGPGVPENLRDAIFEPFRQGPTASPHAPGTGIGLSLVARFADLHGGSAWVEDRPGGGASFKVRLPDRGGHPLPAVNTTSTGEASAPRS
ncbi:MAG: hypothetical protein QOI60_646 [Actinomycetota bacterium]|nr:hypothetical protein [Actinomycetota bacterium]